MSILLHGDCLEEMKSLDDKSIDLIFCDLPYGQTSCKWDCKIDLEKFWIEVMRIKKLNTPIFMTTTTKFGVELINSAPKKCHFRYDIVWVKSAPAGFLSAKKMPMRKHEMIYVFYEKLPFYDLSSHTHKFIKDKETANHKWIKGATDIYGKAPTEDSKDCGGHQRRYVPPLPVSVVTEGTNEKEDLYGMGNQAKIDCCVNQGMDKKDIGGKPRYDPPLPTTIVKEDVMTKDFTPNKNGNIYDCQDNQEFSGRNGKPRYDPPLPTTIVTAGTNEKEDLYGQTCDDKNNYEESFGMNKKERKEVRYDPPLPNSMLEIKSTRGKHSTEKPVALMEWILKYYSKEGDVILDPTMGSGSTGVACKNMNRNFIGIEMDPEIYEGAVNRIED